jgi:hypothetical protein
MNQRIIEGILVTKPTREDVQSLKVGDLAPDCFGKMSPVVRIYATGEDLHGRAYVLYYVAFGEAGGAISGAMTEDEIVPTVPVIDRWKRCDLVPW